MVFPPPRKMVSRFRAGSQPDRHACRQASDFASPSNSASRRDRRLLRCRSSFVVTISTLLCSPLGRPMPEDLTPFNRASTMRGDPYPRSRASWPLQRSLRFLCAKRRTFISRTYRVNRDAGAALGALARRRAQTLTQMPLGWALRDPHVTSALIGVSSVAQLEDCVGTARKMDFSEEELAEIDQIVV